jgi:hypothetical protein
MEEENYPLEAGDEIEYMNFDEKNKDLIYQIKEYNF